jgi:DNA-binding NtrC family response regulator
MKKQRNRRASGRVAGVPVANGPNRVDGIIGISPFAEDMRQQILKIAPHPTSVLISGPSGTGKELIARAIHAHSPRADEPFVAVDCASVSGPLFAGHLFGHTKGAFTGADHATLGCFRAANRGTIFLDEIGELDRDLQSNLLRVLQERVVTPLGSHKTFPVDVRVLAATNRDLKELVASGEFREDLYFRLNVVGIKTILLSERPEDIAPLAQFFLQKLAGRLGVAKKDLSVHCLDCMLRHKWPGNVRELQNFLEQAVLLSAEKTLRPDFNPGGAQRLCICPLGASVNHRQGHVCVPLSENRVRSAAPAAAESDEPWPTMDQLQRDHIRRTLQRTGYNQRAAADLLGMHYQQLLRKIKKYGLDNSASRPGRPKKPPQRTPHAPP